MASINSLSSESPNPPNFIISSSGDNQAGTSIFCSRVSSSVQRIQPVSKLVKMKLEDENFHTWKQQALIAIRGYGLEDFIPGNAAVPLQFSNIESGAQLFNPEYVADQQHELNNSFLLL